MSLGSLPRKGSDLYLGVSVEVLDIPYLKNTIKYYQNSLKIIDSGEKEEVQNILTVLYSIRAEHRGRKHLSETSKRSSIASFKAYYKLVAPFFFLAAPTNGGCGGLRRYKYLVWLKYKKK